MTLATFDFKPFDMFSSLRYLAPVDVEVKAETKKSKQLRKIKFMISCLLVMFAFGCDRVNQDESSKSQQREVVIGNQVWMSENLKVDTFRSGMKIMEARYNDEWNKYCDEMTPAFMRGSHGYYYNKFAVLGTSTLTQDLAPYGWRIPTQNDFQKLMRFSESMYPDGNETLALRSTSGWASLTSSERASMVDSARQFVQANANMFQLSEEEKNQMFNELAPVDGNGTNDFGFNAYPTGFLGRHNGEIIGEGYTCKLWVIEARGRFELTYRGIASVDEYWSTPDRVGFMVRAIKDFNSPY